MRNGRAADDLKFIASAGVVVGRTEEEAADKWRLYQQHASIDGHPRARQPAGRPHGRSRAT